MHNKLKSIKQFTYLCLILFFLMSNWVYAADDLDKKFKDFKSTKCQKCERSQFQKKEEKSRFQKKIEISNFLRFQNINISKFRNSGILKLLLCLIHKLRNYNILEF